MIKIKKEFRMARIEVSKTSEEISREIWRDAEAVCFDVDSTVIRIEGIDELASFLGVAEEVKAWYACVSFMQKGTCGGVKMPTLSPTGLCVPWGALSHFRTP